MDTIRTAVRLVFLGEEWMSLRRAGMVLATGMLVAACSGGKGPEGACDQLKDLTRPPDLAAEGADLIARANQARADKGSPPLEVHPSLEEKARSWAARMAQEGRLYHSRVPDGVTANWEKLGENVGQGGGPGAIHEGFLASPAHYGNLIDPQFSHVGVGVASDASGTRYVTEVFMKLAPTPPPAVAPPTTTPTASPPTASPPTTTPPAAGSPAPRIAPPKTEETAPRTTVSPSVPAPTSSASPPPQTTPPVAPPESAAIVQPEPLVAPDRPSRCAR